MGLRNERLKGSTANGAFSARRAVVAGLLASVAWPRIPLASGQTMPPQKAVRGVTTGAAVAAAAKFAQMSGKRVGLIANHTARVGSEHLADILKRTPGVELVAIYAPEHGFRGMAEAGAKVQSGRDPATGVTVFSLYGASKKPTPAMLRGVDVLVFDIQDVGVRSYTYISTMGLAMQAAAEARIPFVVLDRPNPIGGDDVSGFVLEPRFKSFVGQYPIPIVHGLTVGELATMIEGEQWLPGLQSLQLSVVPCAGWARDMRWPETGLPWIATSPNIPTFEAALAYPGIGLIGTTLTNEGTGTPTPFGQFGTPWLDAAAAAAVLNALKLPGVRFEAATYVPQAIAHVANNPRFKGQSVRAVRIVVTDVARYRPTEVGVYALAELQRQASARGVALFGSLGMFHAIAGTQRLHAMLGRGASGGEIIAAWAGEVDRFKLRRQPYLMY